MLMGAVESNPAGEPESDVMTAEEVAGWLRVSVFTVRREAYAGRLPATRVGKGWRFSREAILRRLSEPSHDARYRSST